MNDRFFEAQWRVMAARWPWEHGQEDAMRFYRERLYARASGYSAETLGVAVERVCARQDYGRRPSVDELVSIMRDIEPPEYVPPQRVEPRSRKAALDAITDYMRRRRLGNRKLEPVPPEPQAAFEPFDVWMSKQPPKRQEEHEKAMAEWRRLVGAARKDREEEA